jgi:pimeloyl-ACP methyl ester carboxylesterase
MNETGARARKTDPGRLPAALGAWARLAAALALIGAVTGCDHLNLDGFFYDPLKAPAGGYDLPNTVIPVEDPIRIPSDGQTLYGVSISSSGRRPDITLIYFHGQNSNLGTTWPRLEYLYPLGYNLVMVDPRGYGESTGTPTEAGLQADERAILTWVLDHLNGNPRGLVFYGRSLGSGLAIDLAYQERAGLDGAAVPAVLITESAFASVASFVNDATYVELPSSFVSESSWDNLTKIKSIQVPYLLFHGSADDYVDPRYSDELAAAHPGLHELHRVDGADHSNVPETMGLDAYRAAISDFVEQAIPPASPPAAAP